MIIEDQIKRFESIMQLYDLEFVFDELPNEIKYRLLDFFFELMAIGIFDSDKMRDFASYVKNLESKPIG